MLTPFQEKLIQERLKGSTTTEMLKILKVGSRESIRNALGIAYLKLGLVLDPKDNRKDRQAKIRKAYDLYRKEKLELEELEKKAD